jgi:membrane-associated protease RseP (regulator of RpoE activity)
MLVSGDYPHSRPIGNALAPERPGSLPENRSRAAKFGTTPASFPCKGQKPGIGSGDHFGGEKIMRLSGISRKGGLALAGLFLIISGSVTLLLAQRDASPQVVRIETGGPYLGIEMEDVTQENMAKYKLTREAGVIVRSVDKDSPAEAGQLQANDVILEYAGRAVSSVAELARRVRETPAGRTVNLGVSRDGKKVDLTVKIGERAGLSRFDGWEVGPSGTWTVPRFEYRMPENGVFQFQVPRDRSFNVVVPRVGRQQLGVTVQSLTDQLAEYFGASGKKGILVTSVAAGSPASSVLRAGDIVLSADGKAVADPADLTSAIAGKQPGDTVDLTVIRDKKEIHLSVEFPKSGIVVRGVKV